MSAFEDHSGKISSELFGKIIRPKTGHHRSSVRKGPAYGMDTAVIDLGNGKGLASSSDPVSLIPGLGLKESAWLSVHLLSNDMATTGYAPQYAQFVLNLPDNLSLESFEEYWGYIHAFCDEIGVSIIGGHTAQVPGQQSTTPGGGTMFLQAPIERIVTSDGAEPGDRIVITKESALASSSILAKSFPDTVQKQCGTEIWKQACNNFYRTSSLEDALAAAEILEPKTELKAMHDVTEGGLLGGISELAEASSCGFRVYNENLPSGNAPRQVCDVFGIDHRRCVGAGSMIIAVKESETDRLIAHLREKGVPAANVGELTRKKQGAVLIEHGKETPFTFDGKDPYWNAFFEAKQKGWT